MSSIEAADVKKICLACEAGAGSSLMVKNSLIKKAKKAGVEVEIVHSPATVSYTHLTLPTICSV